MAKTARKSGATKGVKRKASKTPGKRASGKTTSGKKASGKKASTKKKASSTAKRKPTRKASKAKLSKARTSKSKSSARKSGGASLKPGDKVTWGTSQGQTRGRVVKKQTTPTQIKTHKVAASKDNPEYIVESGKSGKRAAHKPSELRKA